MRLISALSHSDDETLGAKSIAASSRWMGCKRLALPLLVLALTASVPVARRVFAADHRAAPPAAGVSAPVPLFRDPLHDGAADPSIIWNAKAKQWWMFYTNRRADVDTPTPKDVSWVHGTRLGIATSTDGAHWTYKGEAKIPSVGEDGGAGRTDWAPEIIAHDGTYHMYLTIVPGIFADWGHPRFIVHLTSPDLEHWSFVNKLTLSSEKVIDPCVFRLPDGTWRLWYKDEADGSHIHYADSPDLTHWTPAGVAVKDRSSEAPKVFWWHDQYWLLTDTYTHGLGVYHSTDATTWTRQQENILEQPGTRPTDRGIGHHPDIVIGNNGRAYLYYFTHQEGPDLDPKLTHSDRRTVLQVTELSEVDGKLVADRDRVANIELSKPAHDPRMR